MQFIFACQLISLFFQMSTGWLGILVIRSSRRLSKYIIIFKYALPQNVAISNGSWSPTLDGIFSRK